MRVLLVNLGSGDTDFMDKGKVFRSIYRRPYLGISYLSSYLKSLGHTAHVVDTQVEPLSPPDLVERVRGGGYDLVGFFAIYVNREDVLRYTGEIKLKLRTPVVVGGPDCYNDRLYLKAGADYVVHGEGEVTLSHLVEHLEGNRSLESVSGISTGRNGDYRRASDQPLIDNLDALPFPDRNYYPINVWHDFMDFNMRKPFTSLITSRGCPYSCEFCDSPAIWRRRVRFRSPENVLAEVDEVVQQHGVRYALFCDDIFGINIEWHRTFCKALAERNHDLHWMCLIHPLVYAKHTEERIELMARAGCRTLHLGVQSSDEEVLQKSSRYATELQHHKRIIATAKKHGILTFSTFIHGLPGDTERTFERNRKFVKDISPHYVLFIPLKIFAGSGLEQKVKSGELNLPPFTFEQLVQTCRRAEYEFYRHPLRSLRLITYILRHNPRWFMTKLWYAIYMIGRTLRIGLIPSRPPRNRPAETMAALEAPEPAASGTA